MIRPYKKPPAPRLVGWLGPNGSTVTDETGRTRHLDHIDKSLIVYTERDRMVRAAQSGRGEVTLWKGRPIRWDVRGRTVLPITEPPDDDDQALAAVVAYRDWVASEGAQISTLGSTAMSLLRATLERPLYLGGDEAPPLREVVGGRQICQRAAGVYTARSWDLRGAYAKGIGQLTYGGRWVEFPGPIRSDPGCLAFCHASVRVPPLWISPLPRRLALGPNHDPTDAYPSPVRLRGIWSWDELRSAWEAGATVKIDRSWVNPSERQPFAPWLQAIERGRALDGFAATLAKRTGARLWGLFLVNGERVRVRYRPGQPNIETTLPAIPNVWSLDLALGEAVCSHVRTRLWREAVLPHRARVIGGHTDSIILQGSATVNLPDDWRPKFGPAHVRWIGPQLYAWRTGDRWSYSAAGIPGDAAWEFDDLWAKLDKHHAVQLHSLADTRAALADVKRILGASPIPPPDPRRWI